MPFSRAPLEEFTAGRFTDFYGSGPVQSGKTTIFYVIPSLYHLFEMEEDVILGAPVLEMAQSAYVERLLPCIEASRYRRLLPRTGAGSRGGKSADWIQFRHGPSIRFLGAGGGDQQIASYTARVVVATELDKMDEPGKVSRETDPVSKLKARTKAFGSSRRFYGECTMSTKGGRIYKEVVELGTDSQVYLPCQHCGEWILPQREGLIGWQEKPDVVAARASAAFQCPNCEKLWTEFDRQKSLRDPRIVARDQTVTKDGVVQGDMPRTMTYGFRWNAMASPLLKIADIATDEWEADQANSSARKKEISQYTWAEPFEEELADLSRPDVMTILGKIVGYERGVVPPGTVKLTLGIDCGYTFFWTLWAWKPDAQGHLVDFGAVDVPLQNGSVWNPLALLHSLVAFRENVIKPGWSGRQPDRIVVDSGYEQAVVYEFVKESGQPRYLASKGFGTVSRHGGWHSPLASAPTPQRHVGNEWTLSLQPSEIRLLNFHADYWKSRVHDGFWAGQGAPGSLTIFRGEKTDPQLRVFARMIVAEQREVKTTGEKEPRVVWVQKSRSNHYLDTSTMARLAADIEGIRLVLPPPPRAARPPRPPNIGSPDSPGRRIRYKY